MSEKIVDKVEGSSLLTSIFGYWPSFHDAEVLRILIDREPAGGNFGPHLDAWVHTFEITSEVSAKGTYVLRHHVLVHLRFCEVTALELEGFNHQNALMGLKIRDISDRQMERVKFEVSFDPAYGAGIYFECYSVAIKSVEPYEKSV